MRPSARLPSLAGQRVRIVGYRAQAEEPPLGGFHLCPFPQLVTEAVAGTAALPPQTVFVVVCAAKGMGLGLGLVVGPAGPVSTTRSRCSAGASAT